MATNELKSTLVPLEFSEDDGTTWLTVVCRKTSDFNVDVNITEEETDCGTIVAPGTVKWGGNVEGVLNTAPTATQASWKKLLTWATSGTKILYRQQSPGTGTPGTDFYQSGECYISNLKQNYATANNIVFSATFKGNGALDITP
jgi:hypothetical protein